MIRSLLLALALCLPLAAAAQPTAPATVPPLPPIPALQALDLSTTQKAQLLGILMDAAARQQAVTVEQRALLAEAEAELSTGTADLAALAAQQEAITDQRIAAVRATRDSLLVFYATLDDGQQAEVQQFLAKVLARIDAARSLLSTLRPWLGEP